MTTRLLPRPFLSLIILGLWLVLAPTMSVGNLLLAAFFAVLTPILTASFWPEPVAIRRPLTGLRLFGIFMHDVLIANWIVARLVVGPIERLRPSFVEVPLDMQDSFVATILGSIVSLTPGTVSVDVDRERWVLLVHALDVDDPDELIRTIKRRYEAPLKETFGC